MRIIFNKAYKITPLFEGASPMIAVGIKNMPTTIENDFKVDKYVFLTSVDEIPGRKIYAREIEDAQDYRIIRDIIAFVEASEDLQYRIEPLTVHNWHHMRDVIPQYEQLFDNLRTEDELNAYYVQQILEPNLEWYTQEVLPGRD